MRKRRNMKERIFLVAIVGGISFFVSLFTYRAIIGEPLKKINDDVSCYNDPSTLHGVPNLYSTNELPIPGRSIFFHETSCFGNEGISITSRQACAVESAAKMNPNMTIYLLVFSPDKFSNVTSDVVEQLTSYNNVRIRRILIDDYVKNTPLENWYTIDLISTSKWSTIQMADIVRFLTLWKFGGIYLDLDVVVTTMLDGMTDFVGIQDKVVIGAGVIGIGNTDIGRRFADACLRNLIEKWDGQIWGNNALTPIKKSLAEICGTKHLRNMTKSRCHGFELFPPSAFYPIHYTNGERYFTRKDANETMRIIENARAIHVWNKLTSREIVNVGSQVPYDIVAKKYCPRVYENCGKTF